MNILKNQKACQDGIHTLACDDAFFSCCNATLADSMVVDLRNVAMEIY